MVQVGDKGLEGGWKMRVWDRSPPKHLFDHLNATNLLESLRIDRTDRLPCLFAKPPGTTNSNKKT